MSCAGHNHDPETLLLEGGVKPTANRLLVIRALLASPGPMSLIELETALETMERSSISRVLALLQANDIIHSLEDGRGVSKYEICHGEHTHGTDDDMHAHFYCEECERVFCFEEISAPKIKLPTEFKIRSVNYMVKGLCPECAAKLT